MDCFKLEIRGVLKLFPKHKQKVRLGWSAEGFTLMFSLGRVGFQVCASVSRCPFLEATKRFSKSQTVTVAPR